MKKISFKNIFKKSETGGNKTGKILFILLIIIIAAGAFYWWGYPLLFPESAVKSPIASVTVTTPSPTTVSPRAEVEPAVKEKTEFEIEMEKRKSGYEEKIFVYEPYEPPSNRNPFQKVSTSYFLEETAEKEEEEKEKKEKEEAEAVAAAEEAERKKKREEEKKKADRKSTRLNSSHVTRSRMPSSA